MPLFVWIEGPNGPAPQIWHDDCVKPSGELKPSLQSHKIAKWEAQKRICDLMEDYPYVAPASA